MGECKHEWIMVKDSVEYNKGNLPFYCKFCLELRSIKKEYKGD